MHQPLLVAEHVTEKDLPALAKQLLALQPGNRVFLFEGNLGAGKTTFIKAICTALGSTDDFSSPTYAIVNEYRTSEQEPIFHIDLYRLKSEQEILDAGIEEYLYSGAYCFIEWYQMAANLLPNDYILVKTEGSGNSRKISIFGAS